VLGAILNAAGILLGSFIGSLRRGGFSPASESFLKFALGLFTAFHGLRLAWMGFSGTFGQVLKQFGIALLAVMLGRLLGKLLQLQKMSNTAGQYARKLIEASKPGSPDRFSNGLAVCTILFCASPLGILGAIHSVLPAGPGGGGYLYPLGIKAVMDGLAMIGFVRMFGLGAVLSALPVFVFLAVICLGTTVYLEPLLRAHSLTDCVNTTGGLLLTVMSLVMFEVKRVELADYLPALAVAPLLTWILK
jgi:uncharacterized membrane protein YqgA involved in biofilm formation